MVSAFRYILKNMSDVIDDPRDVSMNEDTTKYWLDMYEKGNTPWHCDYKHP